MNFHLRCWRLLVDCLSYTYLDVRRHSATSKLTLHEFVSFFVCDPGSVLRHNIDTGILHQFLYFCGQNHHHLQHILN